MVRIIRPDQLSGYSPSNVVAIDGLDWHTYFPCTGLHESISSSLMLKLVFRVSRISKKVFASTVFFRILDRKLSTAHPSSLHRLSLVTACVQIPISLFSFHCAVCLRPSLHSHSSGKSWCQLPSWHFHGYQQIGSTTRYNSHFIQRWCEVDVWKWSYFLTEGKLACKVVTILLRKG